MKRYVAKFSKKYIPGKGFPSIDEGGIYDFNCKTVGTITARYYKGIAGHGDNLIIEVKRVER